MGEPPVKDRPWAVAHFLEKDEIGVESVDQPREVGCVGLILENIARKYSEHCHW